jgi:hypothetical protein
MLGVGILTGLVFPPIVSPFVGWKTGMHFWFNALSIVAGVMVGGADDSSAHSGRTDEISGLLSKG